MNVVVVVVVVIVVVVFVVVVQLFVKTYKYRVWHCLKDLKFLDPTWFLVVLLTLR